MNKEELLRRLRRDGPDVFVEQLLFDNHSWFFPNGSNAEYETFRESFASVFKVDKSDIAVVGSGKYGFSLSPKKDFRLFQAFDDLPDPSDLDLVVVSKALFNETWHHLRRAHYQGAIKAQTLYQENIFKRFILVGADDERDTRYLRDLSRLVDRVRKLATTRFAITQTIKLRVYASWTDTKAYHIWSMQQLAEQHGIQ